MAPDFLFYLEEFEQPGGILKRACGGREKGKSGCKEREQLTEKKIPGVKVGRWEGKEEQKRGSGSEGREGRPQA